MFDDLVALFSGWYQTLVQNIRDLLAYQVTEVVVYPDGAGNVITDTVSYTVNPSIWSAYVPWEQIIAAVVLIVFIICIFKFMRSVLCKIL